MNNVNSKTIETERLVIRPSRWDDTDTFYEWELLPEVTKFFSIRDNQSKEDVVRKYVADSDDPKARQFTICLKAGTPGIPEAGGRMIGRIVLADIEEGRNLENLHSGHGTQRQGPRKRSHDCHDEILLRGTQSEETLSRPLHGKPGFLLVSKPWVQV